jgi:phosphoribosylaminoimidazole (AIR) synthetase
MLTTFNMGLGMVLVSEQPIAGYPVVGEVVKQTGPQRLLLE